MRRVNVAGLPAVCAAVAALIFIVPPAGAKAKAKAPATRPVLVVSNNWAGTADFIDTRSYKRLLRLNVIPDLDERMAEVYSNPLGLVTFLVIRVLIGEGHDQYVDDAFTSPDGRTVYISRPSFADVIAIDLKTRKIIWRTPVDGDRADHMAISPDGKTLAVSASTANKVEMIHTATGKVYGNFPSGDSPHENNYSRDGSRIFHASIGRVYVPLDDPDYAATKGNRWFEVVDAKTLKVLKRIDISKKLEEAGHPGMSAAIRPMAITPDEKVFDFQLSYLHGYVEYDLEHDRITKVVRLPNTNPGQYLLNSAHHGLAMNPRGTKLCVAGTMDDYVAVVTRKTGEFNLIAAGPKPYWATNSPDGRHCYVSISGDDAISVIDYKSEQQIARIPVGDHPQRSRVGRLALAAIRRGA